jgi:hypothetical protein
VALSQLQPAWLLAWPASRDPGGIRCGAARRGVGSRVAQEWSGGLHRISVGWLRPQPHVVHRVQKNPTVPTVTQGARRKVSKEMTSRDGLADGETSRRLGNRPPWLDSWDPLGSLGLEGK